MKRWRVGDDDVLVADEKGGFARYAADGRVLERRLPRQDSVRDELHSTRYELRGSSLIEVAIVQAWRRPDVVRENVKLEHLRPLEPGRAPTSEEIRAFAAAHEAQEARAVAAT